MYIKYTSRCFSNKRLLLTLFSLALIFMIFGAGLYIADSINDERPSSVSPSVDDSLPVNFPLACNLQHFRVNALDYGNIVFRGSKHEVPVRNAYSPYSKQHSYITVDHTSTTVTQISVIAQAFSDKGSFYLRC